MHNSENLRRRKTRPKRGGSRWFFVPSPSGQAWIAEVFFNFSSRRTADLSELFKVSFVDVEALAPLAELLEDESISCGKGQIFQQGVTQETVTLAVFFLNLDDTKLLDRYFQVLLATDKADSRSSRAFFSSGLI